MAKQSVLGVPSGTQRPRFVAVWMSAALGGVMLLQLPGASQEGKSPSQILRERRASQRLRERAEAARKAEQAKKTVVRTPRPSQPRPNPAVSAQRLAEQRAAANRRARERRQQAQERQARLARANPGAVVVSRDLDWRSAQAGGAIRVDVGGKQYGVTLPAGALDELKVTAPNLIPAAAGGQKRDLLVTLNVTAGKGDQWRNPVDDAGLRFVPEGLAPVGPDNNLLDSLGAVLKDWPSSWLEQLRRDITAGSAAPARDAGGYWMYETEVTVAQFERYCKAANQTLPPQPGTADTSAPVVNVPFVAAKQYCVWLQERLEKEHQIQCEVVLPAIADWQYAALGGAAGGLFVWGNGLPGGKAGNLPDQKAGEMHPDWEVIESYSDGYAGLAPVRTSSENGFSLFDLAGNAAEWCVDRAAKPATRGGSWRNQPLADFLIFAPPAPDDGEARDDVGFRPIVRNLRAAAEKK